MTRARGNPGVVVAPEDGAFAIAGGLVLAALAVNLLRRSGDLVDSWPEFMVALFLGALAAISTLLAAAQNWTSAAQLMIAFTSAAPAVTLFGAFAGFGRARDRSFFALPAFRWSIFCVAVGLAAFGWGAGIGGSGAGVAQSGPAIWVAVPTIVAACLAMPISYTALRRKRGPALAGLQLEAGALVYMIGLAAAAGGNILIGGGAAMMGAAVLYSGLIAFKRGEGADEREPEVRPPKRERTEPVGPGRKVLIPKGNAQRVTRFRDDDPLPREEP
jgi:hypothetical protein